MKRDTVIVGGGPAGVITALTAKDMHPEKTVCMIKEIGDGAISCAIPYMIHSMDDPEQNRMSNTPLEKAGIEVIVDRASAFDPDSHVVKLGSGDTITYDRLVLASGTLPSMPPIGGTDLAGVFAIEKSLSAMTALRAKARESKRVVILGGGFIGAEFADELARGGNAEVHVVEMMPKPLQTAFDDEFCDVAQQILQDSGVIVHTDTRAVSINGNTEVSSVTLADGEELPADMVLVGVGGKPNVSLAKAAGLRITDGGSIWVDAYMKSSVPGVFAVGDCAVKRDFFTRREVPVWLASTATAEARIAGSNLYEIRVLRQIQGTIAAFSTRFGGVAFASAGLTARTCEQEGFRYVEGVASAPDRHPGSLAGASEMHVKLLFADTSGILLGGQVKGGDSVGELINVIALGIQKKITVRELDMMQIATHPLLTAAPTVHPLINAAHQALGKLTVESP
jgi:NADH oxidase (H2O2-forming)